MPDVVGIVRPIAFVFENVPGLLTGENEAYTRWLIDRLRTPAAGLNYAVAAAVFNAADFGVPQIRRRVFIVGLLGKPASAVHKTFDAIAARRTHADPRLPLPPGRAAWNTIDSALPGWAHAEDGWRRWITVGAESDDLESPDSNERHEDTTRRGQTSRRPRISLSWPHRDCLIGWTTGGWTTRDEIDDPLAYRSPAVARQRGLSRCGPSVRPLVRRRRLRRGLERPHSNACSTGSFGISRPASNQHQCRNVRCG